MTTPCGGIFPSYRGPRNCLYTTINATQPVTSNYTFRKAGRPAPTHSISRYDLPVTSQPSADRRLIERPKGERKLSVFLAGGSADEDQTHRSAPGTWTSRPHWRTGSQPRGCGQGRPVESTRSLSRRAIHGRLRPHATDPEGGHRSFSVGGGIADSNISTWGITTRQRQSPRWQLAFTPVQDTNLLCSAQCRRISDK
jgi:hypothetical protein